MRKSREQPRCWISRSCRRHCSSVRRAPVRQSRAMHVHDPQRKASHARFLPSHRPNGFPSSALRIVNGISFSGKCRVHNCLSNWKLRPGSRKCDAMRGQGDQIPLLRLNTVNSVYMTILRRKSRRSRASQTLHRSKYGESGIAPLCLRKARANSQVPAAAAQTCRQRWSG